MRAGGWLVLVFAACGGSTEQPTSEEAVAPPVESSTSSSGSGGAPAPVGSGGTTSGTGAGGAPSGDFFGESRCDSAGLLFCDGFEAGTLDPARWDADGTHGEARIDGAQAARGAQALHVTSPAAEGALWLAQRTSLPVAGDVLFARVFVYPVAPLPTHNWNYMRLVGSERWQLGGHAKPFGDPSATRFVRLMHQPLHEQMLATLPFDSGRWICWEMEYRAAGEVVHVWVDDTPVSDLDPSGDVPWEFPEITAFEIGFQHAHDEPTMMEVWIDEVALDQQRIGCSK
jgi:hypothetical protein